MPTICYVDRNFKPDSLAKIQVANAIIAEYEELELTLTLRQLYYQMVARDFIPNTQREYQKLSSLITDARLAGLVDWHALEDRTRFMRTQSHFDSPEEMIKAAAQQYRLDKWLTQTYHVEVLIEKDALVGVIEGVCRENDVTFASCRGYMSASMVWESAMRLKRFAQAGKELLVIHLGDHDPSGKHMTNDIEGRLRLFLGRHRDKLEVRRIALNYEQIEEFNPPPNPAKMSDPRADDYVAEFGKESWELDALDPKLIASLIRDNILSVRDDDAWAQVLRSEAADRNTMSAIADNYSSIEDFARENDWIEEVENDALVDDVHDEEDDEAPAPKRPAPRKRARKK